MICLSWNCPKKTDELRNLGTVQQLHHLVKTNCPQLVFLIETKCCSEKVELIRNKIGFDNSFVVNSKGWRGGLALLWKSHMEVKLDSFTEWHIFAI